MVHNLCGSVGMYLCVGVGGEERESERGKKEEKEEETNKYRTYSQTISISCFGTLAIIISVPKQEWQVPRKRAKKKNQFKTSKKRKEDDELGSITYDAPAGGYPLTQERAVLLSSFCFDIPLYVIIHQMDQK